MGILGSFANALPQTLYLCLWAQNYANKPKYSNKFKDNLLNRVDFFAVV